MEGHTSVCNFLLKRDAKIESLDKVCCHQHSFTHTLVINGHFIVWQNGISDSLSQGASRGGEAVAGMEF